MVDLPKLDLSATRVLIVEDSKTIRQLLRAVLDGLGAGEVVEATDGADGLRLALGQHPDLVIADWSMPAMDGLEMTRRIRASEDETARFVPIIMLTAHRDRARVTEARDAGVTEFIVKPFTVETLYARIVNIVLNGRVFIRTKTFFGPDRRRFVYPSFNGPDRRGAGVRLPRVDISRGTEA